jgi:opacity protein-like surface antigen
MRTTLLRVIALSALCASPLLAQGYPQTREGFTATFGLGFGSAGVSCDECESERESAPTVHLRLGGAYRPNLILAGEINGWSKTEDSDDGLGGEARVTMATINFVAQWYPQPTSGFFLNGGLGLGTIRTEIDLEDLPGTFSSNTSALGYQVGAGWDFRVSRNISITPYANFFGSAGGKVEDSDEKIDFNVGSIGIGLTFH